VSMSSNNNSASKIDKVQQILKALESGMKRDAIAYEMGYTNPKSLDIYMRRKGFLYDRKSSSYVSIKSNELIDTKTFNTTKRINYILSSFSQEEADPKTIAALTGFENHIELAEYMKNNGFEWNDRYGNYTKDVAEKHVPSQEEDNDGYDIKDFTEFYIFLPLLRKLYERKDSLLRILNEFDTEVLRSDLNEHVDYKDYIQFPLSINTQLYMKLEKYAKVNSIEINTLILYTLEKHIT
jgi:hypothetical protein